MYRIISFLVVVSLVVSFFGYMRREGGKITPDENTRFFNNKGKPVVYYFQRGTNGTSVEFFNKKGHHPQFGVELLPVDKEVVEEFLKDTDFAASRKGPTENTRFFDKKGKPMTKVCFLVFLINK